MRPVPPVVILSLGVATVPGLIVQTLQAWSPVAAIAGGAGPVTTLALARLVPLV